MLPPTGHRPQRTRPSAASFTSASQPPPPAASRTAPRSPAAPPPDAQSPLATLRRPSPDHWPDSLAVTVAPPPRLPTHSASEPPDRPSLPIRHYYWSPATLFPTTVGLYPCQSTQSPPRRFVHSVAMAGYSPPSHCDHWSLPPDFHVRLLYCFLQITSGLVHGPAIPWPPAPSPSLLATAAKAFVPSPINHNRLGPPLSSFSPIKSQTLHKSTLPPSWISRMIAIAAA